MSEQIGILTFHYSNNYGAVLQAYAMQQTLQSLGYSAEIVNFVPSSYKPLSAVARLRAMRRTIGENPQGKVKAVIDQQKKMGGITRKFDTFRKDDMTVSREVDESTISTILSDYSCIIVGSDQVWNPYQRAKPEYFLNFTENRVKKLAYAADSSTSSVSEVEKIRLKPLIEEFKYISVRNQHSMEFVKTIIGKSVDIVADPTILHNFATFHRLSITQPYILVYALGKDIAGTNRGAIEIIKKRYPGLPIYSIKDATVNSRMCNYADREFFDLGPKEWLDMLSNATFVFTDSYHGALFALKFHKPFLAYYSEEMRAGRLIDIGERYGVDKYIIGSVDDILKKQSLAQKPDYNHIDKLLRAHKDYSLNCLVNALKDS